MAEPSPDVSWPPRLKYVPWHLKRVEARRQKRLADFVRPHLQPSELIDATLSVSYESPRLWGGLGRYAVVVTKQQVFVIRLRFATSRPKEMLAICLRDDVTIEWAPDDRAVGIGYNPTWYGRLSVSGPFGTMVFWAADWHQFHAWSVAIALERS